jgi:methionine aminopeptidase
VIHQDAAHQPRRQDQKMSAAVERNICGHQVEKCLIHQGPSARSVPGRGIRIRVEGNSRVAEKFILMLRHSVRRVLLFNGLLELVLYW